MVRSALLRASRTMSACGHPSRRGQEAAPQDEEEASYAAAGCRTALCGLEIISVISAATMHSAPAAKNAGRYVAHTVRDTPAPKAAVAAPSWWPAKIQP